jgi:hypothetical protein
MRLSSSFEMAAQFAPTSAASMPAFSADDARNHAALAQSLHCEVTPYWRLDALLIDALCHQVISGCRRR